MDEDQKPLTIKERMLLLQQESARSSASSSSSSAKPPSAAPAAPQAAVKPSESFESTTPASTSAADVLVAELREATSAPQATPRDAAVPDALSAYPPLSPTLSASSSRPASPYMSPTSAYDSLADQSNRRRAGSSASALSALSSVSRESGERGGLEMEMGGLGVSSERPSVKSMVSSREGGSAPLPKLDTKPTSVASGDSLMAFSPIADDAPASFPPASAQSTPAPPLHSPPSRRSTVASTSSQSSTLSLPPRLPPRRSQSTAEPPSPTASTFSVASNASSQGPALPPRPRASAAPAATPPRPSPSSASSLTPTSRPAYARHSPKARQDGFESVSLTSAGGAELAKSLATASSTPSAPSAPTISHPLSSPSGSFSSAHSAPRPVNGRQRPVEPRARKRYDALFEKCLRKAEGGGAPKPAWVKVGNGDGQQRLDGAVVRGVWMRSRLDRDVLRGIWTACDPDEKGSLDREGWIRGMWMIDEELRRCQKDRS